MKKSLIIAGLIFSIFLSGCAAPVSSSIVQDQESSGNVSVVQPESVSISESKTVDSLPVSSKIQEISKEELVYDEGGVKIYYTGIDNESWVGSEVKFRIENGHSSNIVVQTRDVSVNGYMITPFMSATVASGKTANDNMTVTTSDLKDNSIENITDIELVFVILEKETFETIATSQVITIAVS